MENENYEDSFEIHLRQMKKILVGEIASVAEYRIKTIPKFANFWNFNMF